MPLQLIARDFAYTYEGQTLSYTVLDEIAKTCEVRKKFGENIFGKLYIPTTAKDGEKEYTITRIANAGFYGCVDLTAIDIPTTVIEIGGSAFAGCSSIKDINFSPSLKTIRIGAFGECDGLTSITIPNTLLLVENQIFRNCKNLKTVIIEDGDEPFEVGSSAFFQCPVETLYLGRQTFTSEDHQIGNTFSGIKTLTNLTITQNVTSIEKEMFSGCSGITGTLFIPESVTYIGEGAFYGCSGITGTLTIPESILTISDRAFYGCTGIEKIILPSKLNSLGESPFAWCKFLTILSLSTNPPTGTSRTFNYENYKATLYVPDGSVEAYKAADIWKPFFSIKPLGDLNKVEATGIAINPENLALKVGESNQLSVVFTPENTTDKSVTWASSDEAVATVDENGKVTAVAVSKAVITATTANGLKAECAITVVETPASGIVIDLEAMGITGDNLEMRVGEVKAISAKVEPETATDKSLTFESADPAIASVDAEGNIKAHALGKTTITIKAASGVSATITVVVVETPAESITLNRNFAEINVSENVQLEATVLPETTSNKTVTWTSDNEAIATVDATGKVTGVGAGTTTITATTANGLTATCEIKVNQPVTGIEIDLGSLGISGNDLYLYVGDSREIKVKFTPADASDKSLTFTSSNAAIAQIDANGVLTATAVGEATVTITAVGGAEAELNVTVMDRPVSTVAVSVSPLNIREGGKIVLSADEPTGGYANGWEWSWMTGNEAISNDIEAEYTATMAAGDQRATEERDFAFKATDRDPYGNILADIDIATEKVTIYRKPQTPKQMLRKGDGTSHTFIAMAQIDDRKLSEYGYVFVYGYTDANGADHTIGATPLRYCRTSEAIYTDPANRFWVYAEWNYEDGSTVTSGLRYLDGGVDEDFDASVFGKHEAKAPVRISPDEWITTNPSGISINVIGEHDTDICVYDMQGKVVKHVTVESGAMFSESITRDDLIQGIYIIRIASGTDVITNKFIIR